MSTSIIDSKNWELRELPLTACGNQWWDTFWNWNTVEPHSKLLFTEQRYTPGLSFSASETHELKKKRRDRCQDRAAKKNSYKCKYKMLYMQMKHTDHGTNSMQLLWLFLLRYLPFFNLYFYSCYPLCCFNSRISPLWDAWRIYYSIVLIEKKSFSLTQHAQWYKSR